MTGKFLQNWIFLLLTYVFYFGSEFFEQNGWNSTLVRSKRSMERLIHEKSVIFFDSSQIFNANMNRPKAHQGNFFQKTFVWPLLINP